MTSCCTLAENSQLFGRTPHPFMIFGSYVVATAGLPKFGFNKGLQKSGANWGPKLDRSQFTILSLLRSSHTRLAEVTKVLLAGSLARAILIESCWTLRLTLPLIAVLPLPNRSYDALMRGFTSFQLGTFLFSGWRMFLFCRT